MKNTNNIFEHSECISEEMLLGYISEKLSPSEKHAVEKHLLDCAMCSDAEEGLRLIADKNKISKITADLNKQILQKTGKKEAKIIFLQQYRTQLAIAASIVIIFGLVLFFRNSVSMDEIDSATAEKIFADKFEPIQEERKGETNLSEPEQISHSANVESASTQKYNVQEQEDAPVESSDLEVAENKPSESFLKKAESKNSAAAKEVAVAPTPSTRSEVDAFASDEALEEVAVKQTAVSKSMSPTKSAAGVTSDARNDDNKDRDNYSNVEISKNENQTHLMALETKSKSEKKRAKGNRSDNQPAQAEPATPANTLSVGNVMKQDSTASNKMKASEGAQSTTSSVQAPHEDAIVEFERVLKNDPNNYHALFYTGVHYLGGGETERAVKNLNKVFAVKDGEFYDATKWYLALAYIKMKDVKSARKNLSELEKNPDSKFQKQAAETLKELAK